MNTLTRILAALILALGIAVTTVAVLADTQAAFFVLAYLTGLLVACRAGL